MFKVLDVIHDLRQLRLKGLQFGGGQLNSSCDGSFQS
jgi:hypothetical protein